MDLPKSKRGVTESWLVFETTGSSGNHPNGDRWTTTERDVGWGGVGMF